MAFAWHENMSVTSPLIFSKNQEKTIKIALTLFAVCVILSECRTSTR